MTELGQTGNPTLLVPGNPEAIEENVIAVRGRGRSLEAAGNGLGRIDTGVWQGEAGNAFRDKFGYESARWLKAADAFNGTAKALEGHAETLRWAQTQAQEAIHRWEQGEAATRQAKSQHQAAVTQASRQNAINTVQGNSTVAPFVDPGEEYRQAARDQLDRARRQLADSGERAANEIRLQSESAPQKPSWLGSLGGFLGDVAVGTFEGVVGLVETSVKYGPQRLMVDPVGWTKDSMTLAQGVAGVVQHPSEFGKALIDYDTWKQSPGRAVGHLIPDIAIAAVTAGAGGVAARGGRATARAAERVAKAASRVAERVGSKGEKIGRAAAGHKKFPTREVRSRQEIDDIYNSLARDGKEITPDTYKGKMVELPDGTRIGYREVSKTSSDPTLDITLNNGDKIKVHVNPKRW